MDEACDFFFAPMGPTVLEEKRPDIAEALQKAAMTPRYASRV
jgi:hypothetical protein